MAAPTVARPDQPAPDPQESRAMLSRTDLRGRAHTAAELRRALPRGGTDIESVLATVAPVVAAVRDDGVRAALDFGARFDGVTPPSVRVPAQVLEQALGAVDPTVRTALEESIRRARIVHADQRRSTTRTEVVPGGSVTEKWIPVARVGLYVPGGNAVYPSSVIMNVVPAQEAGVASLVVASPPQAAHGGWPHPRSSPRARCSGSTRCGPSAAPRPSHSSPTVAPTSGPPRTPPGPSWRPSTSSPGRATST